MNSIRMIPPRKAESGTPVGMSQLKLGCTDCGGWFPLKTRTSAVTDSTTSMTSSMPSSTFWKFAETSMPR